MKKISLSVICLIAWYCILITAHQLDQRPLWHDELCVLDSILHLKPVDLFTRPLLSDQEFPRSYLWTIQQFSKFADQNPLVLRFFSFIAMVGAFFVWLKIARRVLVHAWDMALFIGSWCACLPLVYYASELKPYSMDVLASGLIVLFLLDQGQKDLKSCRLVLFLLPFFGLWSYPAIFLLLLPLYNLVRGCFNERRWLPELSYYLAGYIMMLALVYLFDFRVSAPHLMQEYWNNFFFSFDSLKDFLNTFGKGMNNLVSRRFAENPHWVKVPNRIFIGLGFGYMLVAMWDQLKKDNFVLRSVISITFAMFLVQLVLAILRIFPFSVPRMSLYFTPLLLLMTIMALRYLCERQKILGTVIQCVFAGYLVFVSWGIAWDVLKNGYLVEESFLYSTR